MTFHATTGKYFLFIDVIIKPLQIAICCQISRGYLLILSTEKWFYLLWQVSHSFLLRIFNDSSCWLFSSYIPKNI